MGDPTKEFIEYMQQLISSSYEELLATKALDHYRKVLVELGTLRVAAQAFLNYVPDYNPHTAGKMNEKLRADLWAALAKCDKEGKDDE
jgi:hypothetical protein